MHASQSTARSGRGDLVQNPGLQSAWWDSAVLRWLEGALLAVSRGQASGQGFQGPTRIIQGQQGHNPFSTLRAGPCEVDRTHREVPREGSRAAEEVKTNRLEEALGRRFWHCPPVARASHKAKPEMGTASPSFILVPSGTAARLTPRRECPLAGLSCR